MKHKITIWAVLVFVFPLIFASCTPNAMTPTVDPQILNQMHELENRVAKLEQPKPTEAVDALVQQQLELLMRVGELSARIAKDEFKQYDGIEKGLVDYNKALQTALNYIHHPEGQPYFLLDAQFIPSFHTLDPNTNVEESWEFLIHSPNLGHFYVAIDARKGEGFFTNSYP